MMGWSTSPDKTVGNESAAGFGLEVSRNEMIIRIGQRAV